MTEDRANQLFLKELELCHKGWDPFVSRVGASLYSAVSTAKRKYSPLQAEYFKVYTTYINNFSQATMTLHSLTESNEDFVVFLKVRDSNSPVP